MNTRYHYIPGLFLTVLLMACGSGTGDTSVKMSRGAFVAPFQNQYDNLGNEIRILEKEYRQVQEDMTANRLLRAGDTLRLAPYYAKFDRVCRKTDEILEAIDKIESGLIQSLQENGADTLIDPGQVNMASIRQPESNEINRGYFRNMVQNIASELSLKVTAYNKFVHSGKVLLYPGDSSRVLIFSKLHDKPDPNNSEPFYWEDYSLINVPVVSSLVELRSLRASVLKTGISAAEYVYGLTGSGDFRFNAVALYMNAESMQVHKGEEVQIRMGIKAWNEGETPLIIINGDTATHFENGEALYTFRPRKTGLQKLKGELYYSDPRTGEPKSASTSLSFRVKE